MRGALHWACAVGSLEMVELLLAAGADPTATTTRSNQSVRHLAKDPGVLRCLMQLSLPLECRNDAGETPLLCACCGGKRECVKALLAAGANIHDTDNQGWGVLHCSVLRKRTVEVMQLLLDHGKAIGRPLNVNAPDMNGMTPLMLAARGGCSGSVKALLAAGADVAAVDGEGRTALHHVGRDLSGSGSEQVYQLLISAGGDVFAVDNNNTPLKVAFARHARNSAVVQLMDEQVAQVPQLRGELASISGNLQTLITGAAAEMRRLDRARTELQHQAQELEQQRQQLHQREVECEQRERELNLCRRLG